MLVVTSTNPPPPPPPDPNRGWSAPQSPGASPYQQQPYGQPQYGQPVHGYGQPMVDHPQGTTILVLGILSLVLCSFLGPFAWVMGNRALREIDAAPGRYSNRGSVSAGRICGIISSVLMIVALVIVVIAVIVTAASDSP